MLFFPAIALLRLLFPVGVGILLSEQAGQACCGSILRLELHRREAVRPLEDNTSHITSQYLSIKKSRLTVCVLTYWRCAYGDEVVFREAAGCDVVLQELLGKVLVHLSCLVGVHAVPTGLVQI